MNVHESCVGDHVKYDTDHSKGVRVDLLHVNHGSFETTLLNDTGTSLSDFTPNDQGSYSLSGYDWGLS